MKKIKLTRLLSSLSGGEVKRFKNFLNSPYHNKKHQFVEVFELLAKYHPNYENDKLGEEKVFSAAYPGRQYSYVLLKNMQSDLYELLKSFMAVEEFDKNKLLVKNLFMQNLFGRPGLKELISKEIKIAEALYTDENLNTSYFDNYYQLKKNLCKYTSNVNQYEEFGNSLDEEIESFISMALNNLLVYGLCFESYKIISQHSKYTKSTSRLIEILKSADTVKNPVNKIFYNVLQLLKTDDEKYYNETIEMLKNEDNFLNMDSKIWVYQPIEAFLIKRVKNGEEKFYRPQYELYKHCFESGLYDNENVFAEGKLLMTIETAIRVKEFDWIEKTIEKNIYKVSENTREDYYNFSMAKILQAKGKNEKALDLLSRINLDTSALKSMARNVQLKIYYELGYFELAKAQIDAYRHYISREKDLSDMYKDSVYNFLKFYNKLIDLKLNNDTRKITDFEFEAAKSKNVILKQWLLEKIEELK